MGDLSANFSKSEFACAHCRLLGPVDANLVLVLQRLRNEMQRPLTIVSGWRCATWNRRVNGHPQSQHLYGRAADIKRWQVNERQALAAGAVGVGVRHGWVIHVDTTPGRRPFVFDD